MEYQQLSIEDRIEIQVLFSRGQTFKYIGKQVGKDPTTISREIKRNSINGQYTAKTAHTLSIKRKSVNVEKRMNSRSLRRTVRFMLLAKWSPEQISGRLSLFGVYVSHETIYKWIYEQKECEGINFLQYLRINKKRNKRGGKYRKRGLGPSKKTIRDRPKVVKEKGRIGDWEGDTVEGKKNSGFIATMVDRVSKVLVAGKMENKLATTFNLACRYAFSVIERIFTVTLDNGSEMSKFSELEEALGCDIYFADPGRPGQRGLNENTNGLLRQYFPKGSDFKKLTQKQIDNAVFEINNRPRKSLGYLTPMEVFLNVKPDRVQPAFRF